MIYDTKGALWRLWVRCKDKDLQDVTAFWGSGSPIGQMCQWDMLSYNEIAVLSPSERGARTMSRSVVKNTVVSVTHRWEQHVFQLQILPFLFLLPFLCPVFFSYLFTCFHERFFPERHRKALSAFYTHRFISLCWKGCMSNISAIKQFLRLF